MLLNEYGLLKLCDFGLAKKIVDLVNVEKQADGVREIVEKMMEDIRDLE